MPRTERPAPMAIGNGAAISASEERQQDIANSAELQALADKINVERAGFERKSVESAEHLVRLGELLEEVRRKIRHGGWLKWIDANTGISQRHVYNFMQISAAVRAEKLEVATVASLGVKAALKLVAKPTASNIAPDQPAPPEVETDTAAPVVPETVTTDPHIVDRHFGPLSGGEWMWLAHDCRRATGRGKNRRCFYSDEFMKLVAHFDVPLKDLEAAE
jgi:hypothetical protein